MTKYGLYSDLENHIVVKNNLNKYRSVTANLLALYGLKHNDNYNAQLLIHQIAIDEILLEQWEKELLSNFTGQGAEKLRKDTVYLKGEHRKALMSLHDLLRGKAKRKRTPTQERMRGTVNMMRGKDGEEMPGVQDTLETSKAESGLQRTNEG